METLKERRALNQKLTPEDLHDILQPLQEASLDIIVVGGQAVNLWTYHYALQGLKKTVTPTAKQNR
jgi:hypothetical protein